MAETIAVGSSRILSVNTVKSVVSPSSKTRENSTEIPPLSVSVTAPRRTLSSSNPVSAAKASRSAMRNTYALDVSSSSLRPFELESSSVVTDASASEISVEPNTAFNRRLPRPLDGSAARRRRRFESVCEFKSESEMANSRVNTYSVDPSGTTGHGGGLGGGGDGGDGAMYGGGGAGGEGGGPGGGRLYPSSITAHTPNSVTFAST